MDERVLFVDDEPPVLEGYQRLLRREFAVETALGGEQGLATIRPEARLRWWFQTCGCLAWTECSSCHV
jgi:hypothetical protein